MPLPRQITRTPEQVEADKTFAAQERAKAINEAPEAARRWIAAGAVAEVRIAWLRAKNRGDAELQAIYAESLIAAGEKNPANDSGLWQ